MRQLLNLDFLHLDIGDYKKMWSCAKTVFWYALNTSPPPPGPPKSSVFQSKCCTSCLCFGTHLCNVSLGAMPNFNDINLNNNEVFDYGLICKKYTKWGLVLVA
jgi:hypothetical protein